ncbi:hypothetical protein RF11_11127 [Thelohanellus kitauei]|uniref:Calcineurin-like phosphoesterase domain-containing protein n=1 Tax=Thelohanellus kitauei TaxID=669202 RepID=A0A0C2MEF0_THEKT|nr:hypothetical protein RF11_11127 [Thelohanellus kitauei]
MNIEVKVDQNHLNIVILGDIGLSEAQSNIKKRIVKEIRKINNSTAFNLGMILGDNVYQHGLEEGKFKPLYEVFSGSFRRTEFDFNFLTILGNHDYEGSPATQIRYHYELDNRYYLPYRYYTYG